MFDNKLSACEPFTLWNSLKNAKSFWENRSFRDVNKALSRTRVNLKNINPTNTELIFFFPSFHSYSPFVCLRLNDYKQTFCTTDSLLIVPPPMKCGAIWHRDKWGRLMANKERHSFSSTRFGQKANVFNQIYMFLRKIGCWKSANSWISSPSPPCESYILPGWFLGGTVWMSFLLCSLFLRVMEGEVRQKAGGAQAERQWKVCLQCFYIFSETSEWFMNSLYLSLFSQKFYSHGIIQEFRICGSEETQPWCSAGRGRFSFSCEDWLVVQSSWATASCGNLNLSLRELGEGSAK